MRVVLFALFSLVAAAACAAQPPAPAPALWRIADADSEIWLFGTVHVLPPDLRWESPAVAAAFAAADELVTETALEARPDMSAGFLPPGQSLSSLLPPADRALLARAAAVNRLDPIALERMRPWLAAVQISYARAERAGHTPTAGVETVLGARARASGKRLSHLESPEAQLRTLSDLPQAVQLRFLSATLSQENPGMLADMDRAWAGGRLDELARLLDEQWREAGPDLHQAVILRRNRLWAEAIAARLAGEGRIFVAVGAAHLVGDDSVVELLRARGIAVTGP